MDGDSALAKRVARLEAIEEIRKLKIAYARLCDDGYPPQKLAPLFAVDGVFDAGAKGVHRGRDEIFAFYSEQSSAFPFALHMMVNESIEVSDDLETAIGTWYLWAPMALELEG